VWWTRVALGEYRAAVAFAELLRSMLEAKVPLDLVGMASAFVSDEVSHVEMASRFTMELGGGAPIVVDTTDLLSPTGSDDPLARVNEQMLRLGVIQETFSGALVIEAARIASHPLAQGIETIIARDEAHHMRLGTLYFEWAAELLDAPERERLGRIAVETLWTLSPFWKRPANEARGEDAKQAFVPDPLRELGRLDAEGARARAVATIRDDIAAPLARFGIVIEPETLERLLAEDVGAPTA
jgi:hypothetical protein